MTEGKPKIRVYIDLKLEHGVLNERNVNRLQAHLSLPDYPNLTSRADMKTYAAEVFEQYTRRNGDGKPHYELAITTSSKDKCAIFEVTEPAEQGVLVSNFGAIVSAMKERRAKPVADLVNEPEHTFMQIHGDSTKIYEVEHAPRHILLIYYV